MNEKTLCALKEKRSVAIVRNLERNEIYAKIRLKTGKTESDISVQVQLVDRETEKLLSKEFSVKKICHSDKTLDVTIDNLICKLINLYDQQKKTAAVPAARTGRKNAEFRDAVYAIKDIWEPETYAEYTKTTELLARSTVKSYVSYYVNMKQKILNQYGHDPSEEDKKNFVNQRIKQIYEDKFKDDASDAMYEERMASIRNDIATRMAVTQPIHDYLVREHADDIPDAHVTLPFLVRTPKVMVEQIKYVEPEIYVTAFVILERLCQHRVPAAFAGLGEACGGARVGESTGIIIGGIQLNPDEVCGRYYINGQVDDKGNWTDHLKNEQSRRYLILNDFMCRMVRLRITQLQQDGYSDKEIEKMPLGARCSEPYQFLPTGEVSKLLKIVLIRAGCTDVWKDKIAQRMFANARAKGNRHDIKVSAHAFRRVLSTYAGTGGMDPDTLDALLGHENDNNKKKSYASWTKTVEMTRKLEKCVYLGSLCETRNPKYAPYHLDGTEGLQFHEVTNVNIVADRDLYLTFDAETNEPNDAIQIEISGINLEPLIERSAKMDDVKNRRTRSIVLQQPDSEQVEAWIEKAKKIDLTDIIKEFGT